MDHLFHATKDKSNYLWKKGPSEGPLFNKVECYQQLKQLPAVTG